MGSFIHHFHQASPQQRQLLNKLQFHDRVPCLSLSTSASRRSLRLAPSGRTHVKRSKFLSTALAQSVQASAAYIQSRDCTSFSQIESTIFLQSNRMFSITLREPHNIAVNDSCAQEGNVCTQTCHIHISQGALTGQVELFHHDTPRHTSLLPRVGT